MSQYTYEENGVLYARYTTYYPGTDFIHSITTFIQGNPPQLYKFTAMYASGLPMRYREW